jgi:alkanesulfonate monooxygenase
MSGGEAETGRQEVFDKCLWIPIAAATGAGGNTTALVGTPEMVAGAIRDYYDVGVSNFLIRRFKAYEDTVTYGRKLLPLVKAEVARRDRALPTAHAAD